MADVEMKDAPRGAKKTDAVAVRQKFEVKKVHGSPAEFTSFQFTNSY